MFQTKEQYKIPKIDINEMETSDLPDKEFEIRVIKMLIEVRRKIKEQSENFNEIKIIKKEPNRNHKAKEHNN